MRLLVGLTLLAGGCVVDHPADPTPDPQPAVQPHACIADITLDGSGGSSTPTQLGPLVLDADGASVCLHLDATQNLVAAHFAAQTEYQAGMASAFTTVLQDTSFLTLQDGWDVTVDDNAPRTFANLEWNAPLHEMTDAVLWIRASAPATGTATTTLSLSLFEPFE